MKDSGNNHQERRKQIRFKIPLKVEVIFSGVMDEIEPGITKDFSRGGLRVALSKSSFSPGSEVKLQVFLPGEQESIPGTGNITWIRSSSEKVELGLKLKDMDKTGKAKILDQAYKKWRNQQQE